MAEGKKSFVLYADLIHMVKKMPKEKAGELFLHVLEYVNDLHPKTDDLLIELAFEPIKQQLKRDLDKWELLKEKRSKAGKISALNKANKKEHMLTHVESVQQDSTHSTVNVNGNVNVNVNDIKEEKDKKKTIEERKQDFKLKVVQFKNEFKTDTLKAFFEYWSEANDGGNKMKFEMQKTFSTKHRLSTWKKNESKFSGKPNEVKQIYKSPKKFQGYV